MQTDAVHTVRSVTLASIANKYLLIKLIHIVEKTEGFTICTHNLIYFF